MDLSIYFQPVNLSDLDHDNLNENSVGKNIEIFSESGKFPDYTSVELVIIGVVDDRGSIGNEGCAKAVDSVRKYLYRLFKHRSHLNIADLGNILKGDSITDTYFAVSNVIQELVRRQVVPIIIGGGQDLTYANYLAYEKLEQVVNIVTVDAHLDLGKEEDELNSSTYFSKIVLHQPNVLFNYSNIGYQTYFNDSFELELMEKMYFDAYRLGQVQKAIEDVEPIIRNADILSFDISAIRQSDAPGNKNATPNGFYGEEACQLCRYAGISDKLSSIGFYEINPEMDVNGQTAHLAAQMIWYFLEGFTHRQKEMPNPNNSNYTKYVVSLENQKHDIVFYKSRLSDKWWMAVPYPPDKRLKFERHHLVPCAYSDYKTAMLNEMPDRWWQTYQKLC